ncbi:hypothetical protein Moror_5292 [Moniliophthora roreri MCA 2997]|uniref:DUF6534 domain-containing protein n=1 Tax=Moniliophthora roreri (strain MCA 2997) TaxID=1381753 RepID=V2YBS9_MONRO|nr:hypothetical protein Moror_5292 [Moniliophthora roreri MCA 2997]
MPVIGDLDKSLGGLLAGTWVNSYFFMIELIMCYRYFARYRNDPIWLKLVVVVTLAVDLTSTINHYACVYLYTITHWGDEDYLHRQYWPIPVYLITTGVSAWIVQHFLIYRFWMLSKNWYISIVLVLTSISAMAGSIATAVIIIQHPGYEDRDTVRIPVTIWLGLSAVTDVSITAILIYTLQRMKTNFRKTKNLIKRLTTLAIQTGSPGSMVATIALIIYLNDTESNISVGVAFSLGRVYALTMLHNLNSRAYVRQMGSHTVQGAEDTTMHLTVGETFLRGLQTENLTDTRSEGIHVHRTAVVNIDEQKSVPLEHVESLPTDDHDRENFDVKPSVPRRDSLDNVPTTV